MINKKYTIPALLMLTFLYSGVSQSEILDGGEIRFSGFVTDDAPKWTWQLGSSSQSWTTDIADARNDNGQLVFDLEDNGPLPFLEGYLYERAERGGPGLTPFITFSGGDQPLIVIDKSTKAQQFRASVPVQDLHNGKSVGLLSFTLTQGIGVILGRQEEAISLPNGMSLVNGESVTDVQSSSFPSDLKARLASLLLMSRGIESGISTADNGQVISQSVLADGRVMNLSAAYTSAVSNFELRLPAEGTPAQWRAKLNVTVTVQ